MQTNINKRSYTTNFSKMTVPTLVILIVFKIQNQN